MGKKQKPYGIERSYWDSDYLCNNCGELIYYDLKTKGEYCFNTQCGEYPDSIELYSTEEEGLKRVNGQLKNIEKRLGDIVRTCDYNSLALALLDNRRQIVQDFFSSGKMRFDDFLHLNETLLLIKQYKSLGIRKSPLVFGAILQLSKRFIRHLDMLDGLKEGRYLLAKKPSNRLFQMKYFDIIVNEIWPGYGLVNPETAPDPKDFHYHEAIRKSIRPVGEVLGTDLALYFDQLWPLAISLQYYFKRNYRASLQYQYDITAVDIANILSIIASLKNNQLNIIPSINVLRHFIAQPIRSKAYESFIDLLSGDNNKVPIVFRINGNIAFDRRTLLLFLVFTNSQFADAQVGINGPQRIAQLKQGAGRIYENLFKGIVEGFGYLCLPSSINIGGRDYDIIGYSEAIKEIVLIETKFKDPSPSSLSARTLVKQELTYEEDGLLPQAIKQQERYDLITQRGELFRDKLGLQNDIKEYNIRAYVVTKYTPLISRYRNVRVLSEKEIIEKGLAPRVGLEPTA